MFNFWTFTSWMNTTRFALITAILMSYRNQRTLLNQVTFYNLVWKNYVLFMVLFAAVFFLRQLLLFTFCIIFFFYKWYWYIFRICKRSLDKNKSPFLLLRLEFYFSYHFFYWCFSVYNFLHTVFVRRHIYSSIYFFV